MHEIRVSIQGPQLAYGVYPRGGDLPAQGGKERFPELLQITLPTQLPNPEGGEGESLTIAFSVGAGSPPLLDGCCASRPPGAP